MHLNLAAPIPSDAVVDLNVSGAEHSAENHGVSLIATADSPRRFR
jgi:hypothetical protein